MPHTLRDFSGVIFPNEVYFTLRERRYYIRDQLYNWGALILKRFPCRSHFEKGSFYQHVLTIAQQGQVMTCSVKFGIKLLSHSQTSTVQPSKFGNGLAPSSHTPHFIMDVIGPSCIWNKRINLTTLHGVLRDNLGRPSFYHYYLQLLLSWIPNYWCTTICLSEKTEN